MSFIRYLKEQLLLDSIGYIYDFHDKETDILYNVSEVKDSYAIIEVIKDDEVVDHTLEIEYEIEELDDDYEFKYKDNDDIEQLPDSWDWDKFETVVLSKVKDFERY